MGPIGKVCGSRDHTPAKCQRFDSFYFVHHGCQLRNCELLCTHVEQSTHDALKSGRCRHLQVGSQEGVFAD